MDSWLAALIMSFVEGLTEFLPVSSSGHLILAGELLDLVDAKAHTFEIVIQLGAILAVVALYRQRFLGLLRPRPYVRFSGVRGLWLLFLTSLPAGLLGLWAHPWIKTHLFTPATVLAALVAGAALMIVVERFKPRPQCVTVDDITPRMALGIGLCQCFSLWPGFSRSASTIMGGMLLGVRRNVAAEYSFLAAAPIMVAATSYEMFKSWHLFTSADIPFFVIGMAGAFVSALAAVKAFVGLLGRCTLVPFAVYRLILAPLVYYFMLH